MRIVRSSNGLVFLAGTITVNGFVRHASIPALRLFNLPPKTSTAFRPHPRFVCRRSTPDGGLPMKQSSECEQRRRVEGRERPLRHARWLLGSGKLGGAGKVALLSLLGAATSQVLPHPVVAAESAIPIISSALDGTLMENLTNSGFFQAFSLVFVSEIGDKTFFIAALLAAKTSRLISFAGSVGALAIMTVLAVLLGLAFHSVPTVFTSGLPLDDVIAAAAFLYFGVNTLKDAYDLPSDSNEGIEEEKAEAEESVRELGGKKTVWSLILQTFSLVFAAEFGDRSFLTTIALGAAQSPVGVATGAIAAHASATGIAVTGGAYLSQFISEKVIGYIGGSLFVLFAVTTAIGLF